MAHSSLLKPANRILKSLSWSWHSCLLSPFYKVLCACVLSCLSHIRLFVIPMDCSLPGSSVLRISQARILEWVAMPSSRGSSKPGIEPSCLMSLALAGWFFITSATCEALRNPVQCSSVQSLSHVRLFATPWTAACLASLSITSSRSLLNSGPSSWWCHPTISSSVIPFSSRFQSFPALGLFQWVSSSHQVANVLEFQLQHQSFQWIFRADFL